MRGVAVGVGGDTSFGQVMMRGKAPFRSRWPLTMASMMLGWSEPRFTKQWLTPAPHSASKKADDAVYIVASLCFGLLSRKWAVFDVGRICHDPGCEGNVLA